MIRTTNLGPGVGSVDAREVRAMRLMHGRSLSKGLATAATTGGRSDCTSAKRNGDRDLSTSPSESAFARGFYVGAAFTFAFLFVLALWVRAGGM